MPFLLSRQSSLRFLANLESIITCEGGTRYTDVVHKKGGADTRIVFKGDYTPTL